MPEAHSLHATDHTEIRQVIEERRQRLQSTVSRSGRQQLQELLDAVDAALARIDSGTFGICEVCHEPMGTGRLAGDPLATICLECLSETERRALENDLTLASSIQARLLPARDFISPGWEGHYVYSPHGVVSGDFCDVLPEGDHTLVLLGDVSGKGVSAAMLMSHLSAIFRGLAGSGLPLAQLMMRANRLFSASIPSGSFATMAAARLEPDGSVEICNAGHVPPLLQNGHIRQLPPNGVPLGLFGQTQFSTQHIRLRLGDRLVLVTDGLVESTDHDDREYGLASLSSILAAYPDERPGLVAGRLIDEAEKHRSGRRADDDTTVMVIRRTR